MTKGTVWVVSSLYGPQERWEHIVRGNGRRLRCIDTLGLSLANRQESEIDVIVVEAHAQSEDGLELCRRLRTGFENPLVLVAVGSDEDYCVRAYEAGVDECIATAVTDDLLSAKLNAWLRWSTQADTGAEAPVDTLARIATA